MFISGVEIMIEGVLNMKNAKLFNFQKYLTLIYFIIAIVLFVYALGFMTNIYKLFYNGNLDTLNYYKSIQPFNKELFDQIIKFIIFGVLFFIFQFRKHIVGLLGLILAFITTIYTSVYSALYLVELLDFKKKYNALDLTKVKKYEPSNLVFDLGTVLLSLMTVVSIALLVIVILNVIKNNKKETQEV
jgi:hypothetical protein